MHELLPRNRIEYVVRRLGNAPVVGIFGPRQVGKTTLVRDLLPALYARPIHYLDLEDPRDFQKLEDPASYLSAFSEHTVVIDEVQSRPELFERLRPIIDAQRTPGRFVLLGSVSPTVVRGVSESLAGRIAHVELAPINRLELPDRIGQVEHWMRGGYPNSLFAANDRDSAEWREDYIRSYVTRDLPSLRKEVDAQLATRLLTMCAHASGEMLNATSISKSLGVSQPTVKGYLRLLESSYLVRLLQPYHANLKKRLVRTPKLYLRDSGLANYLLRLRDFDEVAGYYKSGSLWEGYVVEQVFTAIARDFQRDIYFYRTGSGNELDLVIAPRPDRVVTAEIKLNNAPVLPKGYYAAREDLKPVKSYIVTPEQRETYVDGNGSIVIGLRPFLEQLAHDPFG